MCSDGVLSLAECPDAMAGFGVAEEEVEAACAELFLGDLDGSGDITDTEITAMYAKAPAPDTGTKTQQQQH